MLNRIQGAARSSTATGAASESRGEAIGAAEPDAAAVAPYGKRCAAQAQAAIDEHSHLGQLTRTLESLWFDPAHVAPSGRQVGESLALLIERDLDRLPLPGAGDTLGRWRALAAVAACDLSLVKLYEGHTDALAILAELDGRPRPAGSSWGVWAAETRGMSLRARRDGNFLILDGVKCWCSGAAVLSHALVTAWLDDSTACLVAVDLHAPGVEITDQGWRAIGMSAAASVDVRFASVPAIAVGAPGAYLSRAGFWQGGAGIAACWYGAAAWIAGRLRDAAAAKPTDSWHAMHLGAADVALASAAALLRETAAAIDAAPRRSAMPAALRARLAVETAAAAVIQAAGRAMGASPLCRDARFARMTADLPVFLRQSHAERDLAALGESLLTKSSGLWNL
ncbi:MAG: acyl-CoA dehydrogenase [Janthinobacterium lividum]